MEYHGKLYGKIGKKYFDTGKTSADYDKLEAEKKELLENAQMHIDSLDLSNVDFFNKYGFNVAELSTRTRELIKRTT